MIAYVPQPAVWGLGKGEIASGVQGGDAST